MAMLGMALGRMVRHLAEAGGLLAEILEGLTSFLKAVPLAFYTLFAACTASHPQPRALRSLLFTPAVLASVAFTAQVLRLLTWPLRHGGLLTFDWHDAFRASSVFALVLLRMILPDLAHEAFFAMLDMRDAKLAKRLRVMPLVRGIRHMVLEWLLVLFASVAAVALVVVCAPLLVPVLAALGGILLTSTALIAVLVVVALLAIIGGGCSYVLGILSPILTVWRFDPVVALLVAVLMATGCVKGSNLGSALKVLSLLYYSSFWLTQELLAQYKQRCTADEWRSFSRQHAWRIVGFGLPIFALAQLLPLVAVSLLQIFIGCAAGLLVDLLAVEGPREKL